LPWEYPARLLKGLSAGLSTERSQKGLIYFSQFTPSLKGFLANLVMIS